MTFGDWVAWAGKGHGLASAAPGRETKRITDGLSPDAQQVLILSPWRLAKPVVDSAGFVASKVPESFPAPDDLWLSALYANGCDQSILSTLASISACHVHLGRELWLRKDESHSTPRPA